MRESAMHGCVVGAAAGLVVAVLAPLLGFREACGDFPRWTFTSSIAVQLLLNPVLVALGSSNMPTIDWLESGWDGVEGSPRSPYDELLFCVLVFQLSKDMLSVWGSAQMVAHHVATFVSVALILNVGSCAGICVLLTFLLEVASGTFNIQTLNPNSFAATALCFATVTFSALASVVLGCWFILVAFRTQSVSMPFVCVSLTILSVIVGLRQQEAHNRFVDALAQRCNKAVQKKGKTNKGS